MKDLMNYFFIVVISVVVSVLTINRMNATVGISRGVNNLSLSFLLLFIVLLMIIYYNKKRINKKLKVLSFCFFGSVIPAMVYNTTSDVSDFYGVLSVAFVPLGIITGKHFYKIYDSSSKSDRVLFLTISPAIIGLIWIFLMSRSFEIRNMGRDYIFSVVIFLPLVFYIKSPILKYGLLLIILYVVIISTKRTALMVVSCSTIIYMFSHLRLKKMKVKFLVPTFVVIICLLFMVHSLKQGTAKDALDVTVERMSNLNDESAEDRENIYTMVFSRIEESSLYSFVFGHGYNAVSKDIFGHPAHNDYLEIIYDYGVIAMIFYVILLLRILQLFIRNLKYKIIPLGDNMQIFISFVSFVLFNSMNCVITNVVYMYVCMYCIGWSLEFAEFKKYEKIS